MLLKKLLYLGLLALLFLSMIMAVSAMPWDGVVDDPHDAEAIWVDPNSWTTSPELDTLQYCDTFVVDVLVNISGAGPGMYGWDYHLYWDQENINLTDHQTHVPLGLDLGILVKDEVGKETTGPKAGLCYHWYAYEAMPAIPPPFFGVTSLCTYEFHVIETIYEPDPPEIGTLDIQDDIIVDPSATPIPHTTDDGEYRKCPVTGVVPPHPDFTWDPPSPQVCETVTFDASASTPDGGVIVSWDWDFGDGTTATGEIVTHHYDTEGDYTVTLEVTDDDDNIGAISKTIHVSAPPPVGGFRIPTNKSEPLTPWIGLVSVIVSAVAVSGIIIKRKRKQRS